MLTVLQILGTGAGYLCITLFLPWLALHRKLTGFSMSARLMAYFVTGNFYIMNLVMLLQLLHISFRWTLALGTMLPFAALAVRRYRGSFFERLERGVFCVRLAAEGQRGKKTILLRLGRRLQAWVSDQLRPWIKSRRMDLVFTLGICLLVLYMYGSNTVNVYGYCASDMVLHNYWINEMGQNHIFADGIYPFGFHCVIYYLYQVFGIPVYVLLRVFCLVQTLLIHLMLVLFLKMLCKARYTPYIGTMLYVLSDVFYEYTYYRYYATLPQEFGMLFILPAGGFAILFLRSRQGCSGKQKGEAAKKRFTMPAASLVFFALSISLTLTTHFYDTVVAGVLCVGIGTGYCFRCFRWRYMKQIAAAGIMGLLLSVVPMAAAYAAGTPLQASLYWGMSAISSESKENAVEDSVSEETVSGEEEAEAVKETRSPLKAVCEMVEYYTINKSVITPAFILGSIGMLFLLGLLWLILRRTDYGAALVSVSVFTGLLALLQASGELGLPHLMELSRYSIYLAYGIALVWSLCLDGILFLLFRGERLLRISSVATLAASCAAVALTGVRVPCRLSAYETNDAIVCLTNIIRENEAGGTWTICSANDEQRMIWSEEGNGFHCEVIDFLRGMENPGDNTVFSIPTSTVYFFIEKVPILYLDYINDVRSDREVSEEGAMTKLTNMPGITPYVGNARWVTMSHMYYWAQEFGRLYPNEFEVYYETDDFVCYRIRQDGYNLYNFAIDYGYN